MKIVKFKLQNLILDGGRELENYWNLMYRGSQGSYDALESVHVWQNGEFAEFFTYFNSFALKKWLRYTNAEKIYLELRCKGDFTIRLFGHFREGSEIRKEFYDEYAFRLPELKNVQIPIPTNSHAEVVGFQSVAGTQLFLRPLSAMPESQLPQPRIAVRPTSAGTWSGWSGSFSTAERAPRPISA